ncbi:MAG: DNA polymerase III subunit gamma/tau [Candidatus Puniceispirillaceae bacterium]
MQPPSENAAQEDTAYRVLARKYRPDSFSRLIGQQALVTTLTNAIKMGRIAHAFMLTGVRGIGKTSTARLIAKGLNCTGNTDETGAREVEPCNICESCIDIANGRHIDVMEMDAASKTGVNDVRDIIEGAAYRAVSAPYKIYIIDEVHMLSDSAFNALLKTLEEPPENVKFILATTEIRKVPATILSRCQRFDLRRVKTDELATHLGSIAEAETISAEPAALKAIARAAEGSVRDALSMLDQAAAMSADNITEQAVTDMLGQAGAEQVIAILTACLEGRPDEALAQFEKADSQGAEPEIILADMLEMIHQASLMASGASIEDVSDAVRDAVGALAGQGIARLGRAWQLLLAGHAELRNAPQARSAAQMVLIRLAHIAPLPTPAEIIRKLPEAQKQTQTQSNPQANPQAQAQNQTESQATRMPEAPELQEQTAPEPDIEEMPPESSASLPSASLPAQPDTAPAEVSPELQPEEKPEDNMAPMPDTLEAITDLCEAQGEFIMASFIRRHMRPVLVEAGRIDVQLTQDADDRMLANLAKSLGGWTGRQWLISLKHEGGMPTIEEAQAQTQQAIFDKAATEPLVGAVLDTFPSAKISAVNENTDTQAQDAGEQQKG